MKCLTCGQPLPNPAQPCPHCRTAAMAPPAPQVTQRVSLTGEIVEVEDSHYSPYREAAPDPPQPFGLNAPGLGRIGQSHMAPTGPPPIYYGSAELSPEAKTTRGVFIGLTAAALLVFGGLYAFSVSMKRSQVHPLAAQTHLYRSGDRWEYKILATLSMAKGAENKEVRGSSVMQIEKAQGDARAQWVLSHRIHLSYSRKMDLTDQTFLSQKKSDGSLFKLGEADSTGKAKTAAQPGGYLPGKWTPGLHYVTEINFNDGIHEQTDWEIVGTEIVETPAGRFMTWKVEEKTERTGDTANFMAGGTTKATSWYAPQLGNFVKAEMTQTVLETMSIRMEFTLQKTSVMDSSLVPTSSVKPTIKAGSDSE